MIRGSIAAMTELLSHFASDTIKETFLLKRVPIISEYFAKRLNEFPMLENSAVKAFLNAIKENRRTNDLSFFVRLLSRWPCMPRFCFTFLKNPDNQVFKPARADLIFEMPDFNFDFSYEKLKRQGQNQIHRMTAPITGAVHKWLNAVEETGRDLMQ